VRQSVDISEGVGSQITRELVGWEEDDRLDEPLKTFRFRQQFRIASIYSFWMSHHKMIF